MYGCVVTVGSEAGLYMITLMLILVAIVIYGLIAVASVYFGLILFMVISGVMFLVGVGRYLSLRNVPITPTCPYCGNTDIEIQTAYAGTTAGGVFNGGFGMVGTSNNYRSLATCRRCGSTFYHVGIQGKQQAERSMTVRGVVFLIAIVLFVLFNGSFGNSSETSSSINTSSVQGTAIVCSIGGDAL